MNHPGYHRVASGHHNCTKKVDGASGADLKVSVTRGDKINIDVIGAVLTLTDAAWPCGARLLAMQVDTSSI